jgi:peptide/nickel transport system permease protein
MTKYVLRRLALIVPVAWLVTLLTFALMRLLPGDVTLSLLQGSRDPAAAAKLREALGLDQPIHVQYLRWIGGVVRGDFGVSLRDGRPVINDIQRAFPVTLELTLLACIISGLVAIPLGVVSALYQDRLPDYAGRLLSILWLSIPGFWLGTLILVAGARWFRWAPPLRYTPFFDDPWLNLQQFFLPALCIAAYSAAIMTRLTRSTLLEVLRQDYIRTAMAKGLGGRAVVWGHALKNALIPVVTVMGIQVAFLLGGAVVIESVFSLPGLGRLTINAIQARDYPLVQAIVLIVAMLVVLVNLVVDLTYGWIDPRIRYGDAS